MSYFDSPSILSRDSASREGPDQTVWRHMLIWAFAVCICLVKGQIQVFPGDGDSAEAPSTQNFNFDYL